MKETTVENLLRYLYSLQQIDTQLQEVYEAKGDLPSIVEDLEAKVETYKAEIKTLNSSVKQFKIDRDKTDVDILAYTEKIEKYKNQQLNVKSNKQYDALTREIEAAEKKSLQAERDLESFEGKLEIAKRDLETITEQLQKTTDELGERKEELRDVNKEHEKEELKLKHEREKLVVRLDKNYIERYERIRSAKSGLAIVPVKRGACGGCWSRVPPQKILEIRQNTKLFACEHCGRILVSDHIVGTSLIPK